jgi:hypothetical protein
MLKTPRSSRFSFSSLCLSRYLPETTDKWWHYVKRSNGAEYASIACRLRGRRRGQNLGMGGLLFVLGPEGSFRKLKTLEDQLRRYLSLGLDGAELSCISLAKRTFLNEPSRLLVLRIAVDCARRSC